MLRKLREIVGRYWETVKPPYLNSIGTKEATPLSDGERLWNDLLRAGGCVKCDLKPKGFYEGPSGGACTNVFCAQCGQGYNLTPMVHHAELIHKDESYATGQTGNRDGGPGG
jgi:hypothetical protein